MSLGKSLLEAKQASRILKACPICSSLGEDSLTTIAAMSLERKAAKGTYLVTEGDPCSGFYLVLAGKIRVFKTSPSGREKVILIAEPGMTFGEDALFGEGVFLENAVAMEDSQVIHVSRKEFLAMLRKSPELAFQVMESLCGWIRRLSTSVENVAFLGARDKVIRYLVELTEKSRQAKAIELSEKKKDIADRLGITPETFSRVLHELEQKSLIRVEGKHLEIEDLESLKEEVLWT